MRPSRSALPVRAGRVVASALLLAPALAAAQLAPGDSGIRPLPAVGRIGPQGMSPTMLTRGGESRAVFGGGLTIAQPVHEFRAYVANGVGGQAYFAWRADPEGALAIRVDGGGLVYGRENQRVPLGSGRVTADLTTTNSIWWGQVGPQLMAPRGAVRPYVNGGVGFALFNTSSSLRNRSTGETLFSDNNKTDGTFSWSGGGGVLLAVASGVAVDLGARYHGNGSVEYLRRGGIKDLPDGSVRLHPIRSQADLWTYQIGVAFGFGRMLPGRR